MKRPLSGTPTMAHRPQRSEQHDQLDGHAGALLLPAGDATYEVVSWAVRLSSLHGILSGAFWSLRACNVGA